MADSLFQKLQFQAFRGGIPPRTDQSRDWFRDQVRNLRSVNRQRLIRDESLVRTTRPRMGEMLMFFYDPKHKATLPYYDTFPLVIMVEKAPGGFYGLNLHYLPPALRAKFFDALMETMNNKRYDETTRFKARYRILKSVRKLRFFEPCFKHYLTKHVESRIAKVEAPEWEIALFLPVQRFKKQRVAAVYKDSRKAIYS